MIFVVCGVISIFMWKFPLVTSLCITMCIWTSDLHPIRLGIWTFVILWSKIWFKVVCNSQLTFQNVCFEVKYLYSSTHFVKLFFCTTLYVTPKNPNAHALISTIHVTTLSREITYRSLCLRNRIIVTLPSFESGRVFWQANKNWNLAMKTKHPEADVDTEELIRVHVIICHAFCGKFCIKW